MKNFFLPVVVLFSLINNSLSQNHFCGADEINSNRDAITIYTPLDRDSVEWTPKSIPVVVHVLHTGEEYGTFPNISDDLVFQQIDRLNDIFAGEESVNMSNSNISFCVANAHNPSHPEYGIQHHDVTEVFLININLHVWVINIFDHIFNNYAVNPEVYCNIFVFQYESGPEGAAWFPPSNYGLIIRTDNFLSDNPNNEMTIFAHEMGHYLGLQHTWKNTTQYSYQTCELAALETDCVNAGDYVCDTPPTKNHTCTFNCTDNDPAGVLPRNFMGHTLGCATEFTDGQIDLMHSIINYYRMSQVNNECACHLDSECDWDLDGDGVVALHDILEFLSVFNTGQGCKDGDFNNDMFVDTSDLLILLGVFSYNCVTGEIIN
jgi:hypothetical protein